jgi:ribosomal protein S18 acetylase RimI-like enzyme
MLQQVPMRIRGYTPQDLKVLYALDQDCFPPAVAFSRSELFSCLNSRNSVARIAELDRQIIGFAVGMMVDDASAHVITLDVVRGSRRQRVGTILMKTLHEEFRHGGAGVSFLEVDVENTAARCFYEMLQYKYLEYLPGYYRNRNDAFRMIRNLSEPDEC